MIRIHHLNRTRSNRIIWLMEELGQPYELVVHSRDPITHRSPLSLRDLHPLGKVPIIEHDGTVVAESAAIIEYLLAAYDDRKLAPRREDADWPAYIELLHYAEGSAAFPLMVEFISMALQQELPSALKSFFSAETTLLLQYLAARIRPSGYLLDRGFSAVDIHMSYVIDRAESLGLLGEFPSLSVYKKRLAARPAYIRSIARERNTRQS
jgi:glutathione S-transferase